MLEQATAGQVDAITGDYLAEFNLAMNALNYKAGKHVGWERTCEDGLLRTLETANSKRIKIVVDGGALNPKGLAALVQSEVSTKGYDLKVTMLKVTMLKVTTFIPDSQKFSRTRNINI